MTRSRFPQAVVLAAATCLALAACSAHPGAAAVVGSETITEHQLDDVALALCSAQSGSSPAGASQDLAGRAARQGALGVLLNAAVSRQYGASKGVQSDSAAVSRAVTANQSTIDKLPPSRRTAFRDTLAGYAEGQLMLVKIGGRALTGSGTKNVTQAQAVAAGTKLRDTWAARHLTVSVDPRYGQWSHSALRSTSGSLSVPGSARARAGAAQQPAPSWVSALPASQKCS